MWPCLIPVLLVGHIVTLQPNSSHISNVNGTQIEIQSCERGFGISGRAAPGPGLWGVGGQYGAEIYTDTTWSATFLTKIGLSYSDHSYPELPMRGQFELGAQFIIGYEQLRFGVEWWHLSNAGLESPNIGLDMIVLQSGWAFE